jgi:hypothetical protein
MEAAQELLDTHWKEVAIKYGEFGEHTQHQLRLELESCLKAPHFNLCMRNAVAVNPVLSRSKGVRVAINGWTF